MIEFAKLGLYGMFLNYYPFHIMFGRMIPYGSYVFFALIVFGIFGDIVKKYSGKIYLDKENKNWVLYLVLSLATSIFAVSSSHAWSALWKFAIRVFLVIAVTYICKEEKSIIYAVRLLAVTALLSAATAFIQMDGIHGRLSLANDAAISVNDFGSIMSYGCFAVIPFIRYSKIKSEFWKTALTVAATLLLLVEMFIAGSRKSFYAAAILYVLMFIFIWAKNMKKVSTRRVISTIVIGIAVVLVLNIYLLPNLEETSLYERIWGDKAEFALSSDDGRIRLYINAINDFIAHPFFGLGFNNYTYIHSNYTHSTYAEPLACSGLIGLLYLIPYFTVLVSQWKRALKEKESISRIKPETELLIFYIMFMFIGVGIPYIYKDIPCIILGMMVAHQYIERDSVLDKVGDQNE